MYRLIKFFLACFLISFNFYSLASEFDDTRVDSSSVEYSKIKIENAWIRGIDGNLKITNLYMDITNESNETDYLLAVSSPVSLSVLLQKTVVKDNIARSIPVSILTIPGKSTIALAPVGINFVISDPKISMQKGQEAEFIINFKYAGAKKIIVQVR